MGKTAEEVRTEHAERMAQAAREKELARRKALKDAQAKASQNVHRPLVG